ncbi:MAG: hypothetical protein HFF08_03875 [Oscillospiraceae bacterium]|nr:hypothetical protein [Oscillospiraceae bacterium]
MKNKSNDELLHEFENVLTELVKSVNGWNRKSERKLGERLSKLKAEILQRMDNDKISKNNIL